MDNKDSCAVRKWLKKCDDTNIAPWLWDFKNELLINRNNESNNVDNAIIRIFEWYLNENEYYAGETEETYLAKCIYHVLWDIPMEYLSVKLLDVDVMNSFWTTYRHAIKLEYTDPGTKRYSGKINKNTFENLKKNYNDYSAVNEEVVRYGDIKKFAQLTHTIGNFTAEPKFWNASRYKSTKDFWDSTLVFFYSMERLGFNHRLYVERYFMHDYCDKDDNYYPKQLWPGHKLPGKFKPGKEDIEPFITNVNNFIERRGKFMVKRLCEILSMKDLSFYMEDKLEKFTLDDMCRDGDTTTA